MKSPNIERTLLEHSCPQREPLSASPPHPAEGSHPLSASPGIAIQYPLDDVTTMSLLMLVITMDLAHHPQLIGQGNSTILDPAKTIVLQKLGAIP